MKDKAFDCMVKGGSVACAALVAWLTMNCGALYSTTIRRATQLGEVTELDRAGMTIMLAMGCLITLHLNRYHDEITVEGKASFREPHDPSRDRLVTAGPAVIRPLGTGFLVESNSPDIADIIVRAL